MKAELTDAQWLHERAELSVEELAELSGLPPELLRELVDDGALAPVDVRTTADARTSSDAPTAQWSFSAECVLIVRAACRLRDDFDLDAKALSVALPLIGRIHQLEAQLRELQSQLPRPRRQG